MRKLKRLHFKFLLVFIYLLSFVYVSPTFALEQGIQIPSSNELAGLSNTPFNYQWIKYQYVWGSDQPIDQWVASAKQAGFKVLVSVAKKPTAVPTGEVGYQQFGTFMQELSSRLGSNVDAYEIWNEPNLNDEWDVWGQIDPNEYIKLLRYGAQGVKQGNPNAKVITAALAPLSGHYDDEKFFNEFVAAGGLDIPGVDAIGWHSNVTSNIPPENSSVEGFQRVKIALNKGKPVWITEFGWERNRAGINRQTQLQYIQDAFSVASQLGGIETMIIWNFGFGKLNPEFAPWDIGLDSNATSSGQPIDSGDTGCEGLGPQECAVKLTNLATVPDNISRSVTSTPEPRNIVQTLIQQFLGFLGFKRVEIPQTLSTRSDIQVKTVIPDTAQSKVQDQAQRTGENLGYDQENVNTNQNVQGAHSEQGVGIYQFMLPKEVQDDLGKSIGFTCAYENSQYPTGIRPINGTSAQTECNTELGIK